MAVKPQYTTEQILTHLKQLGSTVRGIEETLVRGGHKGQRVDPCGCPIARWLNWTLPLDGGLSWRMGSRIGPAAWQLTDRPRVPRVVREFVLTFDTGKADVRLYLDDPNQ